MTSELFQEWIRKLDSMFRDKTRNITLVVDNCPAHPNVSNLTSVKLVFLPYSNRWNKGLTEVSKSNSADELCECVSRRWIKTSLFLISQSTKP